MQTQDIQQNNRPEFIAILSLLIQNKKLITYNSTIAFIAAVIIAFSIPKEYTSSVIIAPELSVEGEGLSGSIGSLAKMANINLGELSNQEAIYPDLYPQIISSYPFLTELLSLKVKSQDGTLNTDLLDYLQHHQKEAWWNSITRYVKKLFKKKGTGEEADIRTASSLDLSRDQILLLEWFGSTLNVEFEKTTSLITVSATMQDPLIAATVATSLSDKLQKYMDKYHTTKAREDVKYLEGLFSESEQKYNEALSQYAKFTDSHFNPILTKVKTEQSRLESEIELTQQTHLQIAQSLENAKAKLQEKKPICIVIQPATVPFKATSPKKIMLAITFVFVALFGTCAYIILRNEFRHWNLKQDCN